MLPVLLGVSRSPGEPGTLCSHHCLWSPSSRMLAPEGYGKDFGVTGFYVASIVNNVDFDPCQ